MKNPQEKIWRFKLYCVNSSIQNENIKVTENMSLKKAKKKKLYYKNNSLMKIVNVMRNNQL